MIYNWLGSDCDYNEKRTEKSLISMGRKVKATMREHI